MQTAAAPAEGRGGGDEEEEQEESVGLDPPALPAGVPPALSFRLRLEGPANLWSSAALASRRSSLDNDYAELAVAGYLAASGWRGARYRLGRSDAATFSAWAVA